MISNNVASTKAAQWAEQKKAAIERAKRLREERERGVMSENHTFRPETKPHYPTRGGYQKENQVDDDFAERYGAMPSTGERPSGNMDPFPARGATDVRTTMTADNNRRPTRTASNRSMQRLMRGESSVGRIKSNRSTAAEEYAPGSRKQSAPPKQSQAPPPAEEPTEQPVPQQRNATAGGYPNPRDTQEAADEAFMALLRKDNKSRQRKSKSKGSSRRPGWDDSFADMDMDDRPPVHSQPKTYALGYKGGSHAPPTVSSGYGGSGVPPPTTTEPSPRDPAMPPMNNVPHPANTTNGYGHSTSRGTSRPAGTAPDNANIPRHGPMNPPSAHSARPQPYPANQPQSTQARSFQTDVDNFDLSRYISGSRMENGYNAATSLSQEQPTGNRSRLSNRNLKSTQSDEFHFHEQRRPPSSHSRQGHPPSVNQQPQYPKQSLQPNPSREKRSVCQVSRPLEEPAPYRSILYFDNSSPSQGETHVSLDQIEGENGSSRVARYGRRAGVKNPSMGSRGSIRSAGSSRGSQQSGRNRGNSNDSFSNGGDLHELAYGNDSWNELSPMASYDPTKHLSSAHEGRSQPPYHSQALESAEDHAPFEYPGNAPSSSHQRSNTRPQPVSRGRQVYYPPEHEELEEKQQNVEDMPLGTNHTQYEIPEGMEAADEPQELRECPSCGRNFNPQAFEKHAKVCKKVFQSKRRQFDSSKVRVPGEAQQVKQPRGRRTQGEKSSQSNSKNNKWKAKSEELRQAMKAARAMKRAQDRGEDIRSAKIPEMPSSSQENSGFVPCPHCGRTFNETAAERHIPRCQGIQARPSALRKGSGNNAVSRSRRR
eukprot:gb/GECG01014919.1/.p1 GENE.gb/GECG01014919.1/~~gb/GECG01014919.1/.p1  ORF type:complete len:823 (+),score=100.43 gb/GECG01014919.1/:1-2469(+)